RSPLGRGRSVGARSLREASQICRAHRSGGLVRPLDLGMDLFAVDRHRSRGVDAEAHLVALDLEDRDDDLAADDDGLVAPSRQDEHQAAANGTRAEYSESPRTI